MSRLLRFAALLAALLFAALVQAAPSFTGPSLPTVSLAPAGGDDTPRILTAAKRAVAAGQSLTLGPGAWTLATKLDLSTLGVAASPAPSVEINFSPGTVITCTVVADHCITADWWTHRTPVTALAAGATFGSATLATQAAGVAWAQSTAYATGAYVTDAGKLYTQTAAACTSLGTGTGPSGTGTGIADNTCLWSWVTSSMVATAPANGSFIILSNPADSLTNALYTIASGGGTSAPVLDRPVLKAAAFPVGTILSTTQGASIQIHGHGAILKGNGVAVPYAMIELLACPNCVVDGLQVQSTAAHWAVNCDYASNNCMFRQLAVTYVSGGAGWGIGLEQTEGGAVESSYIGPGFGTAAIVLDSTESSHISGVYAPNSTRGMEIAPQSTTDPRGNANLSVEASSFPNSTTSGIDLYDAATGVSFVAVSTAGSVNGMRINHVNGVGAGNVYATGISIAASDFTGASNGGINIFGGSKIRITDTKVGNTAPASSGIGLWLSGTGATSDVETHGLNADACGGNAVDILGSSTSAVRLYGTSARFSTSWGIKVSSADVLFDGLDTTDSGATTNVTGQIYAIAGTPRITIQNWTGGYSADTAAGNTQYLFRTDVVATTRINGATLILPSAPAETDFGLFLNAAATMYLRDVKYQTVTAGAGGGANYGLWTNVAGATVYDMGGVDLSAASAGSSFTATATVNWFNFTANGTTSTATTPITHTQIGYPNTQAGISCVMTAAAGTPGPIGPSSVLTAGALSMASTASNASTYACVAR